MPNLNLVFLFSFLAAGIAALTVWSILRARHAIALAAADKTAAAALSQAQLEAAGAQERCRAAESKRDGLGEELEQLKAELKALREDRDAARTEAAGLRDPAARAPVLEKTLQETASKLSEVEQTKAALESKAGQIPALEEKLSKVEEALAEAGRTESALRARIATLTATLENEQQAAKDKLALLTDAQTTMTEQFKNLANEILEDKSRRFTEQNQTNLGQLLDPLKNQLSEFKTKVEDVYVQEGKERSALAGQVKQLMELNQSLGEDAKNLTRALQGSSKAQGNWGELILERLLENSGLRQGEEYLVQESLTREDGSRALPDVLIRMPNERSLIIDAKVSLNAYEEFTNSENDEAREAARKRHLESLRTHIRGLSERNYQSLHQLKSLDCVVMFIPIEPAFMVAVTSDRDLFQDAWNRNVLLVSPSTLMFVIRTVAHLWRQEAQNRNAQEIARRGAELYDKFAAFVGDLEELGKRLKQADASYEQAHKKLTAGRGNLVRQAEMLRDLGVKPTKALPGDLLDRAIEERSAIEALPAAVSNGEGAR